MAKFTVSNQRHTVKTRAKNPTLPPPSSRTIFLADVFFAKRYIALLFSPAKPVLRLTVLAASLWLAIGASIFGASYVVNQREHSQRQEQRHAIQETQRDWQRILVSHPTSRDALLGAYTTSYALGENDRANQYADILRRIDPNDALVKQLKNQP